MLSDTQQALKLVVAVASGRQTFFFCCGVVVVAEAVGVRSLLVTPA